MNSSENQVKRLTVDDIAVPAGMLSAALNEYTQFTEKRLAAALLWLAENPIVPSAEESHEMREFWISFALNSNGGYPNDYPEVLTAEWQRRMFLRKQAALPDEVKSLLLDESPLISEHSRPTRPFYNSAVLEAYKLGKEGK